MEEEKVTEEENSTHESDEEMRNQRLLREAKERRVQEDLKRMEKEHRKWQRMKTLSWIQEQNELKRKIKEEGMSKEEKEQLKREDRQLRKAEKFRHDRKIRIVMKKVQRGEKLDRKDVRGLRIADLKVHVFPLVPEEERSWMEYHASYNN